MLDAELVEPTVLGFIRRYGRDATPMLMKRAPTNAGMGANFSVEGMLRTAYR